MKSSTSFFRLADTLFSQVLMSWLYFLLLRLGTMMDYKDDLGKDIHQYLVTKLSMTIVRFGKVSHDQGGVGNFKLVLGNKKNVNFSKRLHGFAQR